LFFSRSFVNIVHNYNNNNVYFKSLSYTNVLFQLEMNAQQNKIFWIVRWI